jgi:hypothetical protein
VTEAIDRHPAVQPLTAREIALLEMFADQAVTAIENARLFQELQASNRQVTTALEQHAAVGGVLRVIASSPTDLRQVLDALVHIEVRLHSADTGSVLRVDGDDVVNLVTMTLERIGSWQRPGPFSVLSRLSEGLSSCAAGARTWRPAFGLTVRSTVTTTFANRARSLASSPRLTHAHGRRPSRSQLASAVVFPKPAAAQTNVRRRFLPSTAGEPEAVERNRVAVSATGP